MIFRSLPLDSAMEVTLQRRGDARGFFARTFCEDEFASQGLNTRWVQMNISLSAEQGTVRGLHFQRPPSAEVKLVRCLRGRALDVIVDLRKSSATFGHHCALELDAEARNAIYIPEGFAHGFQTLTDETELQYMHSHRYAPQDEGGINPLDKSLSIDWPLPISQLSDRDAALPGLKECEPL
ncbi:dTDP-4-dehydrorhamnose 3,5-epimerase [Thalassococcus sp. S3]|uniref:dTDP-4-dehydrorhamnose 3,5-epimerase n=1 Tax=Thalassococcus sp. S3 TaxID=2017482 RepID=UPI0010245EC5|nr:dTDP-4-dehydrorhamnose 3,5-epimerase [Thalassococcus sp. S3]QBF29805.1 dTDP-4-dehydrorhamnose 3,5-epimerase [Thalassococcus sp. S3]